jgi:hypothetical protein
VNAVTTYRPFDHWLLVRRKAPEVARFQRMMREVQPGMNQLDILHDGTPGFGR